MNNSALFSRRFLNPSDKRKDRNEVKPDPVKLARRRAIEQYHEQRELNRLFEL